LNGNIKYFTKMKNVYFIVDRNIAYYKIYFSHQRPPLGVEVSNVAILPITDGCKICGVPTTDYATPKSATIQHNGKKIESLSYFEGDYEIGYIYMSDNNIYTYYDSVVIASVDLQYVDFEKGTIKIMGLEMDINFLHFIEGNYGHTSNDCQIPLTMHTTYVLNQKETNKLMYRTNRMLEYKWNLWDRFLLYKMMRELSGDCVTNIYEYINLISPCLGFCTGSVPKLVTYTKVKVFEEEDLSKEERAKLEEDTISYDGGIFYDKSILTEEGVFYYKGHAYYPDTFEQLHQQNIYYIQKQEGLITSWVMGFEGLTPGLTMI